MRFEYLLEREDVGAEASPVALVAFDGFGDIGDDSPVGKNDLTAVILVKVDETRISLAVLEAEIDGDVVTTADGLDRNLRRLGRRNPKCHWQFRERDRERGPKMRKRNETHTGTAQTRRVSFSSLKSQLPLDSNNGFV